MTDRASSGEIRERLLQRSAALRADIARELAKYESEKYVDLADRVADTADEAVADLLSDINLAEISRDVIEFRDVEAALLRLAEGSYGRCTDCGKSIDGRRLAVSPEAARCVRCQQKFEESGREIRYTKL